MKILTSPEVLERQKFHSDFNPFVCFETPYSELSSRTNRVGDASYRTNEGWMYMPSLSLDLAERLRKDGLLREYGFVDPARHHVRNGVHYVYRLSYNKLFNGGPDKVSAFIGDFVSEVDKWLETQLSIETRHNGGPHQLELWNQRVSNYDGYIMVTDIDNDLMPRLKTDVGVTACLRHALMKWGTDNIRYDSFNCAKGVQKHPRTNEALRPRKPVFIFVDRGTCQTYTFFDNFREYFFAPRNESHMVKTPEVGDLHLLRAIDPPSDERLVLFANLITCERYDESMCFSDLTAADFHNVIGKAFKPLACVSNLNMSEWLEIGGVSIFSNIFRPNGIYTAENCPLCRFFASRR